MARTVRDAKLDSRSARVRLALRDEPYWMTLGPGRHLGYRRLGPHGGTWIAKLRDPASGRRWKTALGHADDTLDGGADVLTFAEAQEAARRWFEARRGAGGGDDPARLTTGQVVLDYLAWLERHRPANTAREARYAAEAHILPELASLPVAKLTAARLRRWHEALAEAPRRLRGPSGSTSPRFQPSSSDPEARRARRATANRVLTILKAALNRAYQDGRIGSDVPWKQVRPFAKADAARVRWLTKAEAQRLLDACAPDLRRLATAALLTGARYGELCRARVGDLDLAAGTLCLPETKAGRPRHVPLDDEALVFLRGVAHGRQSEAIMLLREGGRSWGKSHQVRPLLEASARADLEPPANFHCLRHTWASHRVMAGAPLMVVAHVLGHVDTRMVEKHYGHLAPSYVRDVIRATALGIGASEEAERVPTLRPGA